MSVLFIIHGSVMKFTFNHDLFEFNSPHENSCEYESIVKVNVNQIYKYFIFYKYMIVNGRMHESIFALKSINRW